MDKPPIIITGPSGRGKTEFSYRVLNILDYSSVVNIGDVLLEQILSWGETVQSRRDVGRKFFERSSIDDYIDLLREIAKPNTIIDGVRLSAGVVGLRRSQCDIIHVHLAPQEIGCCQAELPQAELIYEHELKVIQGMADVVLHGQVYPISRLDQIIRERILALVYQRTKEMQKVHVDLGPF